MLLDLHATCHIRDTYTQHERLTPTHEYTEITSSYNAIYLVAHQTMLYKNIPFRNERCAYKYQSVRNRWKCCFLGIRGVLININKAFACKA